MAESNTIKFNLAEIINAFEENLYVVVHEDKAYIVDAYHECDKEFDYGVWTSIPVEDLKKGQTKEDVIPNVYLEGMIDFFINDDFPNMFKLSEDEIKEIEKHNFCEWDDALRKMGHEDAANCVEDYCALFKDGAQFKPMTDEEIDAYRTNNEAVLWFEMLKERENGLEMEKTEIGSITCSSEYLAGGDIAQRGYTSTYYRIGDKYYEDYFSFDDYGEGDEEPVRYETEREKIVKAFAEAYVHENTYTDIYAGNLDALADESVSYEIRDEQIQKEVERYVEDIRITKHTKEEHDSLKDIWLNGAESGEYSNSHVSVQMFIKDFTDADKEHFEDLILQDQDNRRLFGGFEGTFYADITDHGSYKELSFDLHKGDFEAAKRLSKIYPEAVVFVNDDWDEHNYEIYRNGKEYNDYTAEWDGDEPEPYREDGEENQYDIDVKVGIRLPFADAVQTCYSGGGDCYEEEFLWYKNQIDIHPKEQSNEEREL